MFVSGVCVIFVSLIFCCFCVVSWCVCLLAIVIFLVCLFSRDLFSGVFRFSSVLRGRGEGCFCFLVILFWCCCCLTIFSGVIDFLFFPGVFCVLVLSAGVVVFS